MSIYRDKAGILHVAIQRGGVRIHRRCERGATLEEAKAYDAKLRHDLFLSRLGRHPAVPLAAAIEEYLTHEARQRSIAKTRQHAYQLVDWIVGRDVSEAHLVAADYVKFQRRRLAPDTINHRLAILRCTAKMAYRREWIQEPLHLKILRLPTPPGRQIYLTREQVQAVVGACPDRRVQDAIRIAAWSGLRLSEIARLTREDVRDGCLLVRQSKTDRPRAVPIAEAILETVARLPLGIGHRTIQEGWSAARDAAGLDGVRFHDLRHTCASWLIQEGVDLYTVGVILGHASGQTTRRYAHLDTSSLKRAMARLDRA